MVIFERKFQSQVNVKAQASNLEDLESKKSVAKKELSRLTIEQLPQEIPNFKSANGTKDNMVAEWLTQWIEEALENGTVEAGNLLPTKQDLSAYFGVSIGTVQNAIRYIEDEGIVESKQRIGTMIRNKNERTSDLRKQTSKRDVAVVAIKNYIVENAIEAGQALPSSRDLAKVIGSAPNTTRLALEVLAATGVIDSKGTRGNKSNWILRETPIITKEDKNIANDEIDTDTLVDQVERDLKELITREFQVNDKLPAHFELSEILKVSIKTVHDAMKRLNDQGIIKSKRGRYGTFIMRMPSAQFFPRQESSIFASAAEASMYNYEKIERHLRSYIKDNYQINDKLPAMGKLAEQLNVSSNTIRKALQKLAEEKLVTFSRGRYGGTFVTRVPRAEEGAAFTWLSVNPQHIAAYRTSK